MFNQRFKQVELIGLKNRSFNNPVPNRFINIINFPDKFCERFLIKINLIDGNNNRYPVSLGGGKKPIYKFKGRLRESKCNNQNSLVYIGSNNMSLFRKV